MVSNVQRRKVRARPMQTWQNMQNASDNFEAARIGFAKGSVKGSVLLGAAMKSALAKRAVMQRLVFDPKFSVENDARFNERLFSFLRSSPKKPFSFAILDLDYLKKLNTEKGYAAADKAIALFIEKINAVAKANNGFAGRFGGDELKILIPKNSGVLKKALEESLASMKASNLSFSAGISSSDFLKASPKTVQQMVEALNSRANRALNQSKKAGRARVTVI